jgi:signal transduction histidine kinase
MPIGTGLGLAICRQIITFFGGEIWADNGENNGARISFNVPFAYKPKKTQLFSII